VALRFETTLHAMHHRRTKRLGFGMGVDNQDIHGSAFQKVISHATKRKGATT
jgi:hypothetical protein